MGRTNPTFRTELRRLQREWGTYRRALRKRDQPHFDRLFEHADAHADAAGHVNHVDPIVPVLVSILVEQEKRIAALEQSGSENCTDECECHESTDGTSAYDHHHPEER